jgi:Fur family peroxide stress response transcriptional regulator
VLNSRPRDPALQGFRRREDVLAAHCRTAGLALTPQRLAIYRALREALDHPSPEGLYARVKGRMPSLSLATVYKTLEALVRVGLAAEVPATGKTKRYDANMERHHHLICTRCDEVRDVYDAGLDRVRPPARLSGFVAHGVSVQIHGLCEACARASTSR